MDRTTTLIEKSHQGDEEARAQLVQENAGLVWCVVKRFLHRGAEAEDLFQIGNIGLLKAIDKFDLSYEVKFSTYAVPMISGEIKRFLRDDGMIKVSRSLKELAYKSCGLGTYTAGWLQSVLISSNTAQMELFGEPVKKEGKQQNPSLAKTEKSRLSEPISVRPDKTAEGTSKLYAPSAPKKPSVRKELREIQAARKKEAESKGKEPISKEKPGRTRQTQHTQPQNRKKPRKSKER